VDTAHNLPVLMRKLFGVGKPRALQGGGGSPAWVIGCLYWLVAAQVSRRYRRLLSPDFGLVGARRVAREDPNTNGLLGLR
jgi:hypothetical protein